MLRCCSESYCIYDKTAEVAYHIIDVVLARFIRDNTQKMEPLHACPHLHGFSAPRNCILFYFLYVSDNVTHQRGRHFTNSPDSRLGDEGQKIGIDDVRIGSRDTMAQALILLQFRVFSAA